MKSRIRVSNEEFVAQQLFESTTQTATELFRQHGTIWLENVFPRAFIEELAGSYHQRYVSKPLSKLKKKHAIVGDQRLMITVKIEPPFRTSRLYANPILMPILESLLGSCLTLSSFGSVVTFPGADDQPVHFDHPPLFESEQQCIGLPPHAITVVVPLVDIDDSTGSTAIWEGSHAAVGSRQHLQSLMENPTWSGSVEPRPQMGDVYLMDYRVIHGGTANRCNHARPILYLVYGRPWFHDTYNFTDQPPIKFGPGEYKKVSKKDRHLFSGYRH